MKNKKLFSVLILSVFISSLSFVFASDARAAGDKMYFQPNVEIPGMENFLGDKEPIEGKCLQYDASGENCLVQAQGYAIDGDSIGQYIVTIYSYAARFVAILAMFMFVIAGWQWLFAAGNAEKVNNAKQTINGVLIGMILLLGGQLLLSQISVGLTNFDTLEIKSDIFFENQGSGCAAVIDSNATAACGTEIPLVEIDPETQESISKTCIVNENSRCTGPGDLCLLLIKNQTPRPGHYGAVEYCPEQKESDVIRLEQIPQWPCRCLTAEEANLYSELGELPSD